MPNARWREKEEGSECGGSFTHAYVEARSLRQISSSLLSTYFLWKWFSQNLELAVLLANEAQDLLVSQPRVQELNSQVMPSF